MKNDAPCQNCKNRIVGIHNVSCHSTCQLYLSFKSKKENEDKEIKNKKEKEYLLSYPAYRKSLENKDARKKYR